MMKIQQGSNAWIYNQNNVAPPATASAIRAAKWNKFLAVNRDATISTFAG
jgi:hypothetical protein